MLLDILSPDDAVAAAIEEMDGARTIPELEARIAQVRDEIGATHLLYHWVNTGGELIGAGTYTHAWRAHYMAENYQAVDPVIRAASQGFHAFEWAHLDWSGKRAQTLAADASRFSLGNNGLTIPIHGPRAQFAHLTVTLEGNQEDWDLFKDRTGRALILLGHFVNRKVLELCGYLDTSEEVSLSPRETDALKYLAMGISRARVADQLGISEHTLRVYIESARHKLGAANTTGAIAKAVRLGLILT